MANAIEQANKNWRQANTIGERLQLTAEEVSLFWRNNRRGLVRLTIREDQTFVKLV